jgi:hypothetical protein
VETVRRKLLAGLAAGLVATLVATALLAAAPALAGARLPSAAARAVALLRAHPRMLVAAVAAHLTYGALAGALFAAGARAVTLGRGLFYGLGLWGLAVAVYAPLVGLGFLAARQPGLSALLLPAHLLYGAVLGALAPRGEIVQPLDDGLEA